MPSDENYSKFQNRSVLLWVTCIVSLLFIANLMLATSVGAGEKRSHYRYSGKSNTGVYNKSYGHSGYRQKSTRYKYRHHYRAPNRAKVRGYSRSYRPLVINIGEAMARKNSKSGNGPHYTSPNSISAHKIENPGGERVIYYNEEKCSGGYDCTIHLGPYRSSPKIIVVGKKKPVTEPGPVIIYPPS